MRTSTNMTFKLFSTAALVTSLAASASAATLVSSALTRGEVDGTQPGSQAGIFFGSGLTTGVDVNGVTTSITSTGIANNTDGPQTLTFRAVSAANGMDVSYDVTFSPLRYDASADAVFEEGIRRNGYMAVSTTNGNPEREQTTILPQGDGSTDFEFFIYEISNVVNGGATEYLVDGFVELTFNALSGMEIRDNNNGDAVLGSGGVVEALNQNDSILLSAPSTSIDVVATADDTTGIRANFDNRAIGLAVQFTEVPEPGSLALIAVGGLMIARRRRG